ncbi:hypothetical protein P7K49_037636 [Saguinus oedipus]|uniref:Uncharacterized protein n=1 Tax=Saguinus oedipus TaxID=9490 RepID=A0ABQ9TIL8_SAGOE|nr:hypothetical protein P7K49_037636 [Saguinus oedipus]
MPGRHQHFQEPEGGCCGEYFLLGFNIVFWGLGALSLATGVWACGEKGALRSGRPCPRVAAGGRIREQLNLFINNAKARDADLKDLIDSAQKHWSCCGAQGPNDWNPNITFWRASQERGTPGEGYNRKRGLQNHE